MRPATATILLLVLLLPAAPLVARASGPAPKAPPAAAMGGDRPGEWKDYDPARASATARKSEQIPSGTLVVVSYIIIWVVVLLYVLLLALRQKRLAGELDQLRRRLEELEPQLETGDDPRT